jgi:hypothetical protein
MVLLQKQLFDSGPSEVLVLAYGAVNFVWFRGCRWIVIVEMKFVLDEQG